MGNRTFKTEKTMIDIIDTHTDKALIEVEYCVNGGDLQTCMIPVWRIEDYYYTNPINWVEDRFEPSPQVQRIAMTSKRNLKRINNPDDVMSLPYAIVATRQRFNIYAGNY